MLCTYKQYSKVLRGAVLLLVAVVFQPVHASGMTPDTTIVLVKVADGEGSINITNTHPSAALLYTSLANITEDKETLLVVTPPIMRVEPGQKQLVRFIVQARTPITTQRLKRVTFDGIPQKNNDGKSTVTMNVRQNLPVIIHPEGLAMKNDPWVLLKWTRTGNTLNVSNDSPYVVRLTKQLTLLPGKTAAELPNNYILAGQSLSVKLPDNTPASVESVQFTPASLYGFAVNAFSAPLN